MTRPLTDPSFSPPELVGHMLRLHLTTDETVLLDPDEIKSLTAHRSETNTTVWRQKNDDYLYFIAAPYEVVEKWVSDVLRS